MEICKENVTEEYEPIQRATSAAADLLNLGLNPWAAQKKDHR